MSFLDEVKVLIASPAVVYVVNDLRKSTLEAGFFS
jgi:hypothetical protein